MYTLAFVVFVGAACAADHTEPTQLASFASGLSGTGSLHQALEADDACLAEHPASLSLLQTRGLPVLDDAGQEQTEASVQRRPAKPAPKTDDDMQIFLQESIPAAWGDVIDAGTGPSSLPWLAGCPVSTLTAVTANESSVKSTLAVAGKYLDLKLDKVIAGQWQDPEFLRGKQFDVVVADWLLGSVEFFAPHFQVGLTRRLRGLVKPGGWLLLSGREPDHLKANTSVGAQLLLDIDALRDAATILGQRHPYRELPQWWVEEELGALGFNIHKRKEIPLDLDPTYVFDQLDWAGDEIKNVRDERLRAALEQRKQTLHRTAEQTKSQWTGEISGKVYGLVARLP